MLNTIATGVTVNVHVNEDTIFDYEELRAGKNILRFRDQHGALVAVFLPPERAEHVIDLLQRGPRVTGG